MLAAFLSGLERFEVKDIPAPKCGPDEVVVRVMACAVCGTDLRIFLHGHRKVKLPWIIGHEVAGEIFEVGSNVRNRFPHIKEGLRVQVVPGISCGRCDECLRGLVCSNMRAIGYDYPGGFEQLLLVPSDAVATNLLPIPDGVSFVEASLAEPISCVLNGQKIIGGIGLGDTVVIIGVGPMGIVHGKLARLQGAYRLILVDISDARLDLAKKFFGTDEVFYINSSKEDEVEAVMDVTSGRGAEKVIVACSSASAQERALGMVRAYGKILYFGGLPPQVPAINFNSNVLHYKSASVYGTFGSTVLQQKESLELIARGFAKGLITHEFSLNEIEEAFRTAIEGNALKVVIKPWGDGS